MTCGWNEHWPLAQLEQPLLGALNEHCPLAQLGVLTASMEHLPLEQLGHPADKETVIKDIPTKKADNNFIQFSY